MGGVDRETRGGTGGADRIRAVARDLDDRAIGEHDAHRAEPLAHCVDRARPRGISRERADVVGRGVGHQVKVSQRAAQELVTHRAADEQGVESGSGERLGERDGVGCQVR